MLAYMFSRSIKAKDWISFMSFLRSFQGIEKGRRADIVDEYPQCKLDNEQLGKRAMLVVI